MRQAPTAFPFIPGNDPGPRTTPWRVWIDTGGTFTDCVALDPDGTLHRAKVLSTSALRGTVLEQRSPAVIAVSVRWQAPPDFVRGLEFQLLQADTKTGKSPTPNRIAHYDPSSGLLELEEPLPDVAPGTAFEIMSGEEAPVLAARLVTGTPAGVPLPLMEMRLATTRGTNTLLERRGSPVALFVTRGFKDLLRIGTQQRPDLFALEIRKPEPLYHSVVEVPERVDACGVILQRLDLEALAEPIRRLRQQGITSAAIALMHSYLSPRHEQALAECLYAAGFCHVSCSHELAPLIKIVPRAETAVVNSYLAPSIEQYLSGVQAALHGGRLHGMTSAGGLVDSRQFRPCDSLLSGPAGGVVGAALAAERSGYQRAIAFDMGGTSTDVARWDGDYVYSFEHRVGDAHLLAPALAIESVASGGGSICSFDGHTLQVGPRSAGAFPGPACYGAGGPLTLTDVHLLLGRLDPRWFEIPVDRELSAAALSRLRSEMAAAGALSPDGDSEPLLEGLLQIADERMAAAIRVISLQQGHNPAEYCLVAFGGAGGQHACGVAARTGIKTILSPADSGLLSAIGLGHARIERSVQQQVLRPLKEAACHLARWTAELAARAIQAVQDEGIPPHQVKVHRCIAHLRLLGQDTAVAVEYGAGDEGGEIGALLDDGFVEQYSALYGHRPGGKPLELVSLYVSAMAEGSLLLTGQPPDGESRRSSDTGNGTEASKLPAEEPGGTRRAWFAGAWIETPVLSRHSLTPGAPVSGLAIVFDRHTSFVIEPGWKARMDASGTLIVTHDPAPRFSPPATVVDLAVPGHVIHSPSCDPVQLELFTNRFTAMVVEMGEMLRRTAVSTNVKERLDFSCALLDPGGELVVNAPHIPVHLGALGLCVRRVADELALQPDDVAVTNHPAWGGSHLPDVTIITPVYSTDSQAAVLLGYVASRAHHAEIGGSRPGSMPPDATRLVEEGVIIPPMYLVRHGAPRWEEIESILSGGPFPSRALADNLADLRAAVAANHRGVTALQDLARQHGIETVRAAMLGLKQRSERQVRKALAAIPDGDHQATEYLDDGTPLHARITIRGDSALVELAGGPGVHPGNLNATPAIVRSVVMYVLRLLVDEPLPLNEGLLQPIELRIAPGMLNPEFPGDSALAPAVVGGNVETSQRLADTLLKALRLAACSQGTMNNVLLGNDRFGYYETVCGGCGAGPGFDGASAVHSHMTNTRITDPEVLEHRYPVRVDRFVIRPGSGGAGQTRGGDGVIRELVFLEEMALSLLTQHRVQQPYGMDGGSPGKPGRQRLVRGSGEMIALQPIEGCQVYPGDRLILETPGGGGWGDPQATRLEAASSNTKSEGKE